MSDHIPLVLKFDDWPAADKKAWEGLFAGVDIFDDEGPCRHWSEGSRTKRRQAYGQWLSYLRRSAPGVLLLLPADRLQIDLVRGYLEECEARLKPRSVSNLIGDLHEVTRHISPDRDWGWLALARRRLLGKSSRRSLAPPPEISAIDIWRWSMDRFGELSADNCILPSRKAISWRQSLMIGFLIARPVRRRALLAITLDHLWEGSDGFNVRFAAEDMKDKRARSVPLPERLVQPMRLYLERHRPVLLGGKASPFLWINQYGQPITADGLSRELPKVTERCLGAALRPHDFRYVVATSIAEVDLEHVNIIRDLLGHATLDMSQKYYNRATSISSFNELQSIIEDIVEDRPRMPEAQRRIPAMRQRKKSKA